MEITNTTNAYFDESTFPPLKALNPSPNLLPHSLLPKFSSSIDLPFEDDEDYTISGVQNNGNQEVPPPPPNEDEVMQEGDDSNSSLEEDQPPEGPPKQHLVLQLGPHLTRAVSDIDPSNIISRKTCSAARQNPPTTTKPCHATSKRNGSLLNKQKLPTCFDTMYGMPFPSSHIITPSLPRGPTGRNSAPTIKLLSTRPTSVLKGFARPTGLTAS
jgi:hypothetical protein